MKGASFLASCLVLCAARVAVGASSVHSSVELAVDHAALGLGQTEFAAVASATSDDALLVRRLASMGAAATDAELREKARAIFKIWRVLNPVAAKNLGKTEDEQFEAFYSGMFKKLLAKANKATETPSPSSSTSSAPSPTTKDGKTTTPSSGSSPSPSSSSASGGKSKSTLTAVSTTDPTEVAESLSFFTEVYDEKLAKNVRALQDNTKNMEAIVQSTKGKNGKNDPGNQFESPTVLEGTDEDTPTPLDGKGRRLADVNRPVQVLFCDVGGNAIWKWKHSPYDEKAPINVTTTVNIKEPTKLCDNRKVEVKVTAYQSGCSRQNHPEGCDNVYHKGCGGLTVNRESNRIVVARTGGRSLGLLYYKPIADECQGRVIDAITHYKGKKFNSPTYAEYNKNGDLFFSDSPFGLAKSAADYEGDILDKSPLRELPFNGVFVLKNGATKVELVDCMMDRPNKIAFSPKQDVMYVTNSRKGNSYVKQFTFKADGSVNEMKTFFNFTAHPELKTDEGYADGIKVDEDGHVYVAVHKGIYIFSPSGDLVGTLQSNREVNGLAIGGGRMFVSGSFGVVAQTSGVLPSIPVPKAKTECQKK